MIRWPTLPIGVLCLLVGARGHAAEADTERDASGLPFAIGNREWPDETQLSAFAKMFCVAMRRSHGLEAVAGGDTRAAGLRKYIDPHYLQKHNLMKGAFPIQLAAVGPIFNIQVADDRKTVLCIVATKADGKDTETIKEAILLRVSVHEGNLYLAPLKAPKPKTGSFTPWILRSTWAGSPQESPPGAPTDPDVPN